MRQLTGCWQWLRANPLLAALFAAGVLVRVFAWGNVPPGLNQDEASIGYDTYALLHYGIDRNGSFLPMHLIAWGSGQNALYAYFSMPFIYLFGLHEGSIRAVSLIFGLLGMWAVYWLAKETLGGGKGAIIGIFLIVICPWHIMMSRWALESNLFPTLVLLAIVCLLQALKQGGAGWWIGFSVLISLSMYAYGTSYFVVPVFLLGGAIYLGVTRTVKFCVLLAQCGAILFLTLPILLFLWINRGGQAAIDLGLMTIPRLTVPRVEQVSSLFGSDAVHRAGEHLQQFLDIYVTGHDGLLWNAIPAFGYLYPISLPFIAIGIGYTGKLALKEKNVAAALILLMFLSALLMTLVTDTNINRINIIFYPTVLLAASGLFWTWKNVKRAAYVAIAAFCLFFAAFSVNYFKEFPDRISPMFYESLGDSIRYASQATEGKIYVTNKVNMPYIFVLFYERINPHDFLATVNYMHEDAPFRHVESFGRYAFEQVPELRPNEDAAYILYNSDALQQAPEGYAVRRFKHFTVISKQ
ncbi:glycosyltransferase family 39 protein [Paenibacillus sp. J5C_2022]|uniref:glycosyltransferase family 39 protein n=1 Tax=Paenibacillus sp. J5C2022 TaxID=2977129 RepID=UPI0021D2CB1B|nr:glycosyltransferase family 39 protein [Paenibacillus sp. J5C2022]MCU6711181.1 glycosyltransferase family 39 protein [Paenibacillus sp. J5C2022]